MIREFYLKQSKLYLQQTYFFKANLKVLHGGIQAHWRIYPINRRSFFKKLDHFFDKGL